MNIFYGSSKSLRDVFHEDWLPQGPSQHRPPSVRWANLPLLMRRLCSNSSLSSTGCFWCPYTGVLRVRRYYCAWCKSALPNPSPLYTGAMLDIAVSSLWFCVVFFFLFIKEPANNVSRCTTGRSLHERARCPVFLLFVKCNITYVAQSFVWKPWRSVTELESHCGPSWSCLSDDCLSRELLWRRTDLKKKKKRHRFAIRLLNV